MDVQEISSEPQRDNVDPDQGGFFDGKSARRWPIEIKLQATRLLFRVVGQEGIQCWDLETIRFSLDSQENPGVIRLYRDGQRIDLTDPRYIAIIRRLIPDKLRNKYFWQELDAKDALRWGGCATVVLLLIYFIWPFAADALAPFVPDRYIEGMGKHQLSYVEEHSKPCVSKEGQEALDGVIAKLLGEEGGTPSKISVGVYNGKEINAYAIAPHNIIVMDGLVQKLSSGDELVGVMAHEIGHLKAKHASRLAVRNLGAGLIADLVGVNQSAMLLDKAYSRDMESEADARGIAMLQRAKISPAVMVDAFTDFAKLEGKQSTTGFNFKFMNFLASHPMTSERLRLAKIAADAFQGPRTGVMTDVQWHAVQNMCEEQKIIHAKSMSSMGDDKAEAEMAGRYLEGKGVKADSKEAFRLANLAADEENNTGQFLVGFMYLSGQGADQNSEKAFSFILLSAEHKNALGKMYAAVMYKFGIGTPVNLKLSDKWLKLVDTVKAGRTIEQAESDIARMLLAASVQYQESGAHKDYGKEFQLVQTSALMGNAHAEYGLATLYSKGEGAPKDASQAFGWALKAAQQDNVSAETAVAMFYQNGIGTPQSDSEAAFWREKAKARETGTASATREEQQMQAQSAEKLVSVTNRPTSPVDASPSPSSLPLSSDKTAIHERPLSSRLKSTLDVMAWSSEASQASLSYDYLNYKEKLNVAEEKFTPEGWAGFTKALDASNIITAMTDRKLTLKLELTGTLELEQEGVENGIYTWHFKVPARLTFAGANAPPPLDSYIVLKVVRSNALQNHDGVGIDLWVTEPRR